jgi:hypothetical protein
VNLSGEQCDKALSTKALEGGVSNDIDAITHQCWTMAERVGIQIAELPVKVRETAFAGAEHCLREAGSELGVAGQQLDCIVNLQMRAIRQIVTYMDVSRNPKGGTA